MLTYTYVRAHLYACARVCVCPRSNAAGRQAPCPRIFPRAELLICESLSAGLTNAIRQLGALCAGKRRDHLASLTGLCENVTFHQAAIYRQRPAAAEMKRLSASLGEDSGDEESAEARTCLNEKARASRGKNLKRSEMRTSQLKRKRGDREAEKRRKWYLCHLHVRLACLN